MRHLWFYMLRCVVGPRSFKVTPVRMSFDQTTLLTAASLSSAALAIGLLAFWLQFRRDRYLLVWSCALLTIIAGIVIFNAPEYRLTPQYVAQVLFILGFALIDAGGAMFCTGRYRLSQTGTVALSGFLAATLLFGAGLSGYGTLTSNLVIGTLLFMTASRYWRRRSESPLAMLAVCTLLAMVAVSFWACAFVLAVEGHAVLTARPANWAEEFNAIAAVVGLTGVGAIVFSQVQNRTVQRHRQEAMTDALTKLPNRRALMQRFPQERIRAGTALVLFDIDHFKRINDRYGHAAGDAVLTRFAEILIDAAGQEAFPVRLGGEEFGAVMDSVRAPDAYAFAEGVRRRFAEAVMRADGAPFHVTVSAGFAIASDVDLNFGSLFKRADRALYDAKDGGRNQVLGASPELIRPLTA